MFDIKWIRDNPDAFDAGLRKRGIVPGGDVKFAQELIALDEARRVVITRLQEVQARRNAASDEIHKAKTRGDGRVVGGVRLARSAGPFYRHHIRHREIKTSFPRRREPSSPCRAGSLSC